MLSVFFFLFFWCLVRCLLPFFCRSSFLRVAFWKNFRERTFVFGWLCWSCVFWWVFANVFALFFGVSLPKLFGKILLMSGLVFFWGRSLFLRFFADVVFVFVFFFERQRSGSNRTPLHTHLFCWFLFLFVSRRFCLFRPFWPCVLLLGGFSGCHSGPRAFLGFSLNLWGLSLRSPLPRPSSWDARRQGFSCASSALFSFPLVFCGHTFSRCPSR